MFLEELRFVFARRRTLISFLVLAAIPILLGVVVATLGGPHNNGQGPPFLDRITHNGVFLGVTAITSAQLVIIPLVISIVAGEAFSAEATNGTLRYLLVAPMTRNRLLLTKSAVVLIYSMVATVFVVLVGLAVGAVLFPIGSMVTLSGSQITLADGIARVLVLGVLAGVSTFSIVAIGTFASTLTDSAIGAAAITFGVVIVLSILDGIPQLVGISPLFLGHYWTSGLDLFRSPVTYSQIGKNMAEQAGWMIIFFSAAWARFSTKDLLS